MWTNLSIHRIILAVESTNNLIFVYPGCKVNSDYGKHRAHQYYTDAINEPDAYPVFFEWEDDIIGFLN